MYRLSWRAFQPAFSAIRTRKQWESSLQMDGNVPHVRSFTCSNPSRVPISTPEVHVTNSQNFNLLWEKSQEQLQLSSIFLRDHCHCSDCQYEDTKQRKLDTFKIPLDICPTSFEAEQDGLVITWAPDDHKSRYSWQWLYAKTQPTPNERFHLRRQETFFDSGKNRAPSIPYLETQSEVGVKKWTDLIVSSEPRSSYYS